jgi:hypothetical protein
MLGSGLLRLTLSVLCPLAARVLGHFSGNFTRVLVHAIKKFKRAMILFSLP